MIKIGELRGDTKYLEDVKSKLKENNEPLNKKYTRAGRFKTTSVKIINKKIDK